MRQRSTRRHRAAALLVTAMMLTPIAPLASGSTVSAAAGPISGTISHDTNFDGSGDIGVAGVTVTAYLADDAVAGTAVTDANGDWTINVSGPVRVEIDTATYPAGMDESLDSPHPASFFADGGQTNLDTVLIEPQRYALGGDSWTINTQRFAGDAAQSAATTWTLDAAGDVTTRPAAISETDTSEVGSVYGIGYSPSRDELYQSAYAKRGASFGPGGAGAIYVNGALLATIPNVGEVAHGALPYDLAYWETTGDGPVGTTGLGGMDLAGDQTLYVVNMFDKSLYSVDVDSGAVANVGAIPNPCGAEWRPMGVKVHQGKVYVGGVCDQALTTAVYAYDINAGSWSGAVHTGDAGYQRYVELGGDVDLTFRPWGSAPTIFGPLARNPQPMLSDIEFDNDGDMLIGLRDRFGDMSIDGTRDRFGNGAIAFYADQYPGYPSQHPNGWLFPFSEGDMYRTERVSAISFTGQSAYQTYTNSLSVAASGDIIHSNRIMGSILNQPDSLIRVSSMDPAASVDLTGDGTGTDYISFTQGTLSYGQGGGTPASFLVVTDVYETNVGKSNGLGDLVLQSTPAPGQVGNRVWLDLDEDGIQDPGEAGVPGVTVDVLAGDQLIGTAVTGPSGYWTVDIPDTIPGNTVLTIAATIPAGMESTLQNASTIEGDSDFPTAAPENTVVTTTTVYDYAGEVDLSFDLGLVPLVELGLDLEKFINGVDADFEPGVNIPSGDANQTVTFVVTNTGEANLVNVAVTDDVYGAISCPAATLAAGAQMTCTITRPAPAPGEIHNNNAEVTGDYVSPAGAVITLDDADPAWSWKLGQPAISLVKTINGADADSEAEAVIVAADSTMNIEFVVTNIGDVPLSNVAVTDDVIAQAGIACPADTLAIGASMTCTAIYPAPSFGESHVNTATATGEFVQPNGQIVDVMDDDPAHAYAEPLPGIELEKYINGDTADGAPGVIVQPGSTMNVTFEITNTTDTTLTNIVLVDDVLGTITCPATTLGPIGSLNDSMTCTDTYPAPAPGTVHTNIATVTGEHVYPDGNVIVVDDTDPANAWTPGTPEIDIIKYINGNNADIAPGVIVGDGSTMNITFEVTNVGDVPLTDVWVFDSVIDQDDISCPQDTLAIGETMTCTATYPAPAIDVQHFNVATAEGAFIQPDGTVERVDDSDGANAYVPGGPSITVKKAILDTDAEGAVVDNVLGHQSCIGDNGVADVCVDEDGVIDYEDAPTAESAAYVDAGSTMRQRFVVTNDGDIELRNIVLTDTLLSDDMLPIRDLTIRCPRTVLQPGESMTCFATFPAPLPGELHQDIAAVRGDYWNQVTGRVAQVGDTDEAFAYVKVVDLELDKQVWAGGVGDVNDMTFIDADNPVEGEAGIVRLDRPFQYKVTVTNVPQPGELPSAASMVSIADLIDVSDAIEILAISTDQGTCDLAAATCDLGTILPDQTVTIIIDAVLPRANLDLIPDGEFMVNDAQVATQHEVDVDSIPGNGFLPVEDDDDPAWVEIRLSDLELVKSVNGVDTGKVDNGSADRTDAQDEQTGRFNVAIGEEVVWSIDLTNQGPDAATGVTVTDVLPADYVYVTSSGEYDPATNTWTVGRIEAGETLTLAISAVLAPDWAFDQTATPVRRINQAEVTTSDMDDPDSFPGDEVVNADDRDDAHVDPIVGKLGDYVWHDIDGDGIQDANEPAVAGVPVTLTWLSNIEDSLGNVIVPAGTVLTTTTNADGMYLFTNLYGGDYKIDFDPPAGFVVTGANEGTNDAKDSDANQAGVIRTTLEPGTTDLTNDMGIYRPAAIGDYVFEDMNADGVQDAGDLPVAGATVKLIGEGWVDHVKLTTTTDANGLYLFDNLRPGVYHVEVVLPDGTVATAKDITVDAKDSDINAAGVMPATQLVSGEKDLTWDAGVYTPVGLGDYVWFDLNRNGVQDSGETGIEGIKVTLTGTDGLGNPVTKTATTDADGYYLFDGLRPGTYQVTFELPGGWEFSPKNTAGAAKDSDANMDGTADPVTLVSGDNNLTIDAGLYQIVDLGIEKQGSIVSKPLGEVDWTITVTNYGPSDTLPGVVVTDKLPYGLNFHEFTAPAGWDCTTPAFEQFENGVFTCTSTKVMKPGDTATFTIGMHINAQYSQAWWSAEPGSIVAEFKNLATVKAAVDQYDFNPDNDKSNSNVPASVVFAAPPVPTGSNALPVALLAFSLFAAGAGLVLGGGFRRRRRTGAA